jgi:hypothetical protein
VAKPNILRFRFAGALAVICFASALTASTAGAGLLPGLLGVNCSSGALVQPFRHWGDAGTYQLAPNGGFEGGTSGWTLTGGAKAVAGNEPFAANSAADSHALALPDGSSATSGPVCLGGLSKASIRFFAANTGSPSSRLHVEVLYRGLLGNLLGALDGGTVSASAWNATPQLLALQLPILGNAAVQLRFTPIGSGGNWRIDDVYTDPWRDH